MKLIKRNIILFSFLIIETFLYVSFLTCDFINIEIAQILKYTAILLCLVGSIGVLIYKKHSFCSVFTCFAMIFTCVSDYFLLLNHNTNYYLIGVVTFIFAQLFYFVIINKKSNFRYFYLDLLIRVLLVLLIIIVGVIINTNVLTIIALVYFVQLFCNFLNSLLLIKINKKNTILSIAFFLFILCDITVALNNLNLNSEVMSFAVYYLMWLFYLPSQVILSTNDYFLE